MKLNKIFNIFLVFSILTIIPLLSGCIFSPLSTKFDAEIYLTSVENDLNDSSQILLVKDNRFLFLTQTTIYVMEKQTDKWLTAFEPFDAVIGRNGFAPPGEKKEGDGKTPSGIYPLKLTFGYDESVETKMPYRQVLEDDIWVDDVNDNDYNRWTKQSKTRAASYEMMKRRDDLYKYGVVIEYNTDPVIKGNGSAIFLHIWKGKGVPTAGCVALSEDNMLKILRWLDPEAAPLIITGAKN